MKIFTKEFLKEIGFTILKEEKGKFAPYPIYGKACDKIGLTVISWSEEGRNCTYFGEKLKENTSISIKKDGGTRTVFDGYVFNQNEIKLLLNLTL